MVNIRRRKIDHVLIVLAFIFIVNVLLKWRFYSGLVWADDFSYGVYAFRLFRVPLPWNMDVDFRMLRLTLMLPVSLIFRVLPPTEFTAVLYPMMLSFGTIYLVYRIGTVLFGTTAGLCAAAVIATFPADVAFGTMLLPDTIVPFYLALSVWAFLKGESAEQGRARFWYLLAGISVFLAFNARENSYYFLLFYVPFVVSRDRWRRDFYMGIIGFTVPILLLYAVYYVKSGDFLYNLHLAETYRDPLIASGYIPRNADNWLTQLRFMFPFLFTRSSDGMWFLSSTYGLAFFLGVPCLVYTVIKSLKRRNYFMLIAFWWFLIGYLFLEFGTISFTSYQMMKKLPRFLLILSPALALGYGVVLADIIRSVRKRYRREKKIITYHVIPGVVLVGIMVILQIFSLFVVVVPRKHSTDANVEKYRTCFYEVLKKRWRKSVFITGGWWRNKLAFYYLPDERYADVSWDRSTMLRDLQKVSDPSELAGSYLILDRSHFNGNNDLRVMHEYDDFGSYLMLPPKEWKLLANKVFFRSNTRYDVELYEIPVGWTYDEPEGRDFVVGSFRHAMENNDIFLAYQNLHPDFVRSLTKDQFWDFMKQVMDLTPQQADELFAKQVTFKEYNGKWKLQFVLN